MKQKYTIIIGDVEMNVVSEETPEMVEKIVGHVDRKIREINLKSARCSKHEAALLCALDYCTEKLSLQAKLNELEQQNDKLFRALERLQRENEKLGESLDLEQTRTRELTASLETAQTQAAQAKAQAQAAAAAVVAASAGAATVSDTVPPVVVAPPVPPAAPEKNVAVDAPAAQDVPQVVVIEQQAAPAPTEPAPATVGTATPVDHIVRKKKTFSYRSTAAARAKNKVGNMFETLTFHDDE